MFWIKQVKKNGLCLLLSLHFSSVYNRGWWRFLPQGNIITLYSYDKRWGLLVFVTVIIFRLELSIQWSAVEFCCDIIVHDTHNLIGQSSDGTLWFLSLFTIHHSFPWASFRKTVRILEQKTSANMYRCIILHQMEAIVCRHSSGWRRQKANQLMFWNKLTQLAKDIKIARLPIYNFFFFFSVTIQQTRIFLRVAK